MTAAAAIRPAIRLLETLRAYATGQAHGAGELADLREANVSWWIDWLAPRWMLPTEDTLASAEQFHANLVAALEWSVADPSRGLVLLSRLGRIWSELGRGGDAARPPLTGCSSTPTPPSGRRG